MTVNYLIFKCVLFKLDLNFFSHSTGVKGNYKLESRP